MWWVQRHNNNHNNGGRISLGGSSCCCTTAAVGERWLGSVPGHGPASRALLIGFSLAVPLNRSLFRPASAVTTAHKGCQQLQLVAYILRVSGRRRRRRRRLCRSGRRRMGGSTTLASTRYFTTLHSLMGRCYLVDSPLPKILQFPRYSSHRSRSSRTVDATLTLGASRGWALNEGTLVI